MRTSLSLIALALGSFAAMPCLAATMPDLTITGTAEVGSNFIDFGVTPTANTYAPSGTYGQFLVQGNVNSSVFPGVVAGDIGSIESLAATAPGSGFTQPFIKFTSSTTALNLSSVPSQSGSGSCVAAGINNVFLLCDTAVGPTALFNVMGTIASPTTPPNGDSYTATFATTFDQYSSVAALLSAAASGPIQTGFTGTFLTTSAVPEPASLALLGLGLFGVGAFARKKVHRS